MDHPLSSHWMKRKRMRQHPHQKVDLSIKAKAKRYWINHRGPISSRLCVMWCNYCSKRVVLCLCHYMGWWLHDFPHVCEVINLKHLDKVDSPPCLPSSVEMIIAFLVQISWRRVCAVSEEGIMGRYLFWISASN